ncbi:DUF4167 domain-containing protein [Porphyrobacter sp. ULC335]|uniref:DUF4167 domain-containing protein n=1 Tax=Porphyrobacter sp. ULC335 TaxID=2854260 RepID=UPI00221F7BC1|nr:DUF4167 domain-containing protein [Porphyrobacter sp. ULC335]UYV16163.1 DUF4167 domain-containing protein [Porphyrobacter sp. ULC335]
MNNNNNNRNNRRRGRGNRNQGGNPSQLNRIDSRARGNAPQMLDKYKKLAQDAQHNGDRVQMEYYLQFADHYFRVIADNKARLDEQRGGVGGNPRRNDEREQAEDFEDDFDFDRGRRSEAPTRSPYEQPDNESRGDVMEGEPGQEGEAFLTEDRGNDRGDDRDGNRDDNRQRGPRRQPQQRKPREEGRDGGRSEKRADRPERAERPERTERPERVAERTEKPGRGRKPRKPADDDGRGVIDSSILPPSIRGDDTGSGESGGALETVE